MSKANLPDSYVQEEIQYNALYLLGSTRTTTGNLIWVSSSSGITYNTATDAGGIYNNQGQYGLMLDVQSAISNYLVTAADFNNKVDNSVELNDKRTNSMNGIL